jgi:hypothetical protein
MDEQKKFNFCFNKLTAQRMRILVYLFFGITVLNSLRYMSAANYKGLISQWIEFVLFCIVFIYFFGPGFRKTPLKYIEFNEDKILINTSRFRFNPKVISKSEIENIQMTKHDVFITITCKNGKKIKINIKLIWLNDIEPLTQILSKINKTGFEYNITNGDSTIKNASYFKRILSSLIDASILYSCLIGAYYFYPQHYEFWLNVIIIFLISIFYHFMLYKNQGKTFGEKYLGLKLIFTQEVYSKNLYYFIKAVIMSIVYVLFLLFWVGTVTFVIGSVLLQFEPRNRSQKILLWDLLSKTAVIDLKSI